MHYFTSKGLALCFALLVAGCTTDLLDQRFNDTDQLAPIYTPAAQKVLNDKDREYILDAQMTNNAAGISNAGKTFRELRAQGIEIAAREKARADLDSVYYKIEADRRAGR